MNKMSRCVMPRVSPIDQTKGDQAHICLDVLIWRKYTQQIDFISLWLYVFFTLKYYLFVNSLVKCWKTTKTDLPNDKSWTWSSKTFRIQLLKNHYSSAVKLLMFLVMKHNEIMLQGWWPTRRWWPSRLLFNHRFIWAFFWDFDILIASKYSFWILLWSCCAYLNW